MESKHAKKPLCCSSLILFPFLSAFYFVCLFVCFALIINVYMKRLTCGAGVKGDHEACLIHQLFKNELFKRLKFKVHK